MQTLTLLAGTGLPKAQVMGPGVPNLTYTQGELFKTLYDFHPVSTQDRNNKKGMNHVAMHKGYLFSIYGEDSGVPGGGLSFYDISDPRSVKLVHAQDEYDLRESHGFGFHSRGGKDFAAMQSIKGIQFWDFTDVRAPKKLIDFQVPGVEPSDYDHGNWWTMWQAPYVFIGRGFDGFSVIDARNPAAPTQLQIAVDGARQRTFPISKMGNFPIGPVFAIGNLLVLTSRGTGYNPGVSVVDIGDPTAPRLLGTSKEVSGYSSFVNGNKVFWAGTDRNTGKAVIQDISDPENIKVIGISPQAGGRGEYISVQDEFIHMGVEDKYAKIDFSNPSAMRIVNNSFTGPGHAQEGFAIPIGNMVMVTDDHSEGSSLVPHQATPDTRPPVPNMASPKDGAVRQPLTSRVGFTFTDQIDVQSITEESFIVRPEGGQPLKGFYSSQINIVNFTPDSLFKANTTYEVVLVKGGIKDYAGNSLDRDYIYRFSTGNTLSTSIAGSQSILRPGKLDVKVEGRHVHFRTAATGLPSEARLVLSDMQGRPKREFPVAQAGEGMLWKGDDAGGQRLPSGFYIARVQSRDRILAHRTFLLP